jgi:Gram-negative porin
MVSQKTVCRVVAAMAFVVAGAAQGSAQTSFKVGEKEVQVHGFIQQGFVASSGNNFLTLQSGDGSGAMTDGGVNVSSKLHKKVRVGMQLYARNVGQFGNGHPEVDWAFVDYSAKPWLGIRAGKVKTTLGLINDTQDMEFLHTWALLPQAVYPLDLRSVSIAHTGLDVYGRVNMKKAGSLAYTAYGGRLPDDLRGGYRYGIEDTGLTIGGDIDRAGGGYDLRWTLPIEGAQFGFSQFMVDGELNLISRQAPVPLHVDIPSWDTHAVYGDYQKDNWHFSGEWRRQYVKLHITPSLGPPAAPIDSRAWFLSAAYRVAKPVEVGAYYQKSIAHAERDASLDNNHVSGPVLTARFDPVRYVSVKVEGHFIDGYGDLTNPHGFYLRNNTSGFKSDTHMLVVRTAFSF